MPAKTEISIITPSYNMLGYLKACVASVWDQQGVTFEHIIADGGSSDGTKEWLSQNNGIVSFSEDDKGMYDAINKGLKVSNGTILSYLNCDEQYLPGTLACVKTFFDDNPDVDIVFGHALLINPDGSLIAFRKGYTPRWYFILSSHLYVLSCTMFFRKKVIQNGDLFDTSYTCLGDAEFVIRKMRQGMKVVHIPHYLSTFTITGSNLSTSTQAKYETDRLLGTAPAWIRLCRYPLNVLRLLEKLFSGGYCQAMPLNYDIYTPDNLSVRTPRTVDKATYKWPQAAS